HTNVVLAQLASRALVIAPDGFADPAAAAAVMQVYAPHVVELDRAQKLAFAGNAIALDGERVWLSTRGAAALRADQVAVLAGAGLAVRHVDLSEIEKAGGSLRCCVGEIF
ncbi:MAG TPA: arginine deiminase-related protein, partial [Rudaea sp.]